MALDTRSVVITIKLEDDSGDSKESKTDTTAAAKKDDKDSSAKSLAVFAVSSAVETATKELVSWGSYYMQRDLSLTDDYIGERNARIAETQINRGISAASTIVSSTASGAAVGGWIGAIIGFALGTTTTALNIVRSNIQGREQQDIALRQLNTQLEYTRSRAGWSTHAASIGEDL